MKRGIMQLRGSWEIRTLAIVSLLGALVALAACNVQRCSEGAVCGITKSSGPSAIPSPTVAPSASPGPSPSPSPAAESCDFDVLKLRPVDGLTVTIGQQPVARLSLTPYQTITCQVADARIECAGKTAGDKVLHEVAEACNLRIERLSTLTWSNSSPNTVTVGTGYEPTVVRTGPGSAVVAALLEGKPSNAVMIR